MICKFNKFGHCVYGKFCNFNHENKKCDNRDCDFKRCNFRHPKDCKYVLTNQKCKFGEFCSFEHEIAAGMAIKDKTSDKIVKLEKIIDEKNAEIERLRNMLIQTQI